MVIFFFFIKSNFSSLLIDFESLSFIFLKKLNIFFFFNYNTFMEKNEKVLISIRNEMENVRELFIKGYINKKTYQMETRDLFELAVEYGA